MRRLLGGALGGAAEVLFGQCHHVPIAPRHSTWARPVGAFSLGMGQRLGIAAALLGDPAVVTLDEPVNGLDPEGVLWVRNLFTGLAAEGRTVMLSSHLMSESR